MNTTAAVVKLFTETDWRLVFIIGFGAIAYIRDLVRVGIHVNAYATRNFEFGGK